MEKTSLGIRLWRNNPPTSGSGVSQRPAGCRICAKGGDLAVASEVGAGCAFKLSLPLQPAAQFDSLIIRPPADWTGRAFIG